MASIARARGDDELGLDLVAGARGEAHLEVRQAIRPRARAAELGRAVHGVDAEDRVAVDGRGPRAVQVGGSVLGRVGHDALDPHLVGRLAPAGEDADAVAERGDRVEVGEEGVPREALEHALADLVGGLGVERHPGHRAERAEPDDHPVEVRVAAGGGDDLAVGGHHLERGDGGGEVAVAVARAVRRRGDRARRPRCAAARRGCGARAPRRRARRRGRRSAPAPLNETVPAARSIATSAGSASSETSSSESAMSVNEWREPRTRTRGARDDDRPELLDRRGRCSRSAR